MLDKCYVKWYYIITERENTGGRKMDMQMFENEMKLQISDMIFDLKNEIISDKLLNSVLNALNGMVGAGCTQD